jgi:dihydroorotase-like cyclic amidohydrolase
MKVKGWVTHTILRGNCIMQDDEILSKPLGEMVKFKETI